MKQEIEIDSRSGFCHGVVSAIAKAEDELNCQHTLYCLGDIVHNSDEVERLQRKGLQTITHDDLHRLKNVKILLRAHGEPPSTYDIAHRNGIEIVDATCPVVLRLQQRIKQSFDTLAPGAQIVIFGEPGHAEVNGLVGQTNGQAIVVQNISELDRVDFNRDIELYSQTTKSLEGFREMIKEIELRKSPSITFRSYDTICRQVSNRVDHLKAFAAAHDVVLFVCGAKSSNGRVLYGHCKDANQATHMVASASEVDPDWIAGASRIGICGATSTPRWLMEKVRDRLLGNLDKSNHTPTI